MRPCATDAKSEADTTLSAQTNQTTAYTKAYAGRALDRQAHTSCVGEPFATKANPPDITTALATKANQSDATTAIATKVV